MNFPLNTLVNLETAETYRAFRGTVDYSLGAKYAYIVTPGFGNAEYFIFSPNGEYSGLVYVKENEESESSRIIEFSNVETIEEAKAIISGFSDTPEFIARYTGVNIYEN